MVWPLMSFRSPSILAITILRLLRKAWGVLLLAAVVMGAEKDGDVWVLTDADIEETLQTQERMMVEFYAPWCGHCKHLAPEYARAAQILAARKSCISLAKIDADSNRVAAQKYGIEGYPTLLYFEKGTSMKYTGGRSAQEIAGWILKKCGVLTSIITTKQDLNEFLSKAPLAGLLFAQEDSEAAKAFDQMAKNFEFQIFAIVPETELREIYSVKEPTFLLVNSKENRTDEYRGPWEEKKALRFFLRNHFDLVSNWTSQYENLANDLSLASFVLFRPTESHEDYLPMLRTLARSIRDHLIVFTCDMADEGTQPLVEMLGVQTFSQPFALIMHPQEVEIQKFPYTGTLELPNLVHFVQTWRGKTAERFYKSEDRPKKNFDGAIRILTGKTYDRTVMDSATDVLVLVCAESDYSCAQTSDIYKQVAHAFRSNRKIVIARIDGDLNDIKGHTIRQYPTLLYYPTNNKEGIVYDGEMSVAEIASFVRALSGLRHDL